MAVNNAHSGEEPRNPHVHHETVDVNARALTRFGITMGLLVVVFLFGLWGMFDFLAKREAEEGRPLSPSALVNPEKLPPQPRLQQDPQRDMRAMRADEERVLHQYAWVDPDQGVVRIPVERAMELIAQRGLPAVPQGKVKK